MVSTQVLDFVGDEDDQRNIAEDVGANNNKYRKEKSATEFFNVHKCRHLIKGDGGETCVLEASQPNKEAHEHEDDSPIDLQHGVVGVLAVEDGVHEHGENGGTHGHQAQVELSGDDGRRRNCQQSHHQKGDQAQPGREQLLPQRAIL